MAVKVERLACPNCGYPVSLGDKKCPAGHPLEFKTFNSVNDMPLPLVTKYVNTYRKILVNDPDDKSTNNSIGICYLKLKMYDKAIVAFEKAVEDNFENSESFFYAAICRLKGKKAFLTTRSDINSALEYLDAAIMIEPKGIYYYFMAYIKYDFFERKYLNVCPDYKDCLENAINAGLSAYDTQELFSILNVEIPVELRI